MDALRILVANSPHIYREAVAAVLSEVCPEAAVSLSAPAKIDAAVLRHAPHLVICSRPTPLVERQSLAWLQLYPDGEDRNLFSIAGRRTAVEGLTVERLADFLGQVERLARRAPHAALAREASLL